MRIMSLSIRSVLLICSAAALLSADTLTLRSGETVQGTFLGGTARQVRMDLNGNIRNYDIADVQSVIFSDQTYQPPPPPRSQSYPPPSNRYPPADRYPSNGPWPMGLVVPVDTAVKTRMIDAVNSDTARLGETFRASLDEPIFVNGQEAIPRGADVLTKLVESQ